MTLASTAQDLMPTARPKVIKSLMRFVETDTTWFGRQNEPPAGLDGAIADSLTFPPHACVPSVRDYRKPSFADRQREAWDPLLRWLEEVRPGAACHLGAPSALTRLSRTLARRNTTFTLTS